MRISIVTAASPHDAVDVGRILGDRGHEVTIDAVVMAGVPYEVPAGIRVWPCGTPSTFSPLNFRAGVISTVGFATEQIMAARLADLVLVIPGAAFLAAWSTPPHPRILAVIETAERSALPPRLPRGVRLCVRTGMVGDALSLSDLAGVERWGEEGASAVAAWRRELAARPAAPAHALETLAFRIDEEPQE